MARSTLARICEAWPGERMSEDLRIDDRTVIAGHLLSWSAVRASGPGGQNVNKVSTKVMLRFDVAACASLSEPVKRRLVALAGKRRDADGRIVIVSQATESQPRNLTDARARLAALVRAALVVPRTRKKKKPSRAAKRRRVEDKRKHAEKKRMRTGVS